MKRYLSDSAITRLRAVTELPDLGNPRYRVEGELARGGMGVVYEAEDLELERRVALKLLASAIASDEAAERMRREARIIARLEHPGIVPVHDVGTLADGRVYYAMKLVRGRSLDAFVRENHSRTELLRVFVRICEAVAFAHANGVVHRDLKPSNVMIGDFGEVLVMDWGVATALADDHSARVIAGTPGYMSPEQARGDAPDPRDDIYALGQLLQKMTPGDRRLTAIARKAAANFKGDRYLDARRLADDVTRWLDQEPVSAYRENVFERAGRWLQRYRALVALIVAYLIMRAIILLWRGI